MRVERTGKIEALTPRLERFMVEALGGKSLDSLQTPEERRADYVCLNGLLAVEVKTLKEDGSERLDNLTDELRQRRDWPVFLGSAPMASYIQHLGNPEPVRLKLINRVGRAIVNHIKKANKQLHAHALCFQRKNLARVLLLVNEDHEIYEPDVVTYIVRHALSREEEGKRLYDGIDAVIYMSERHATVIDKQVAFPIVAIEGPEIIEQPWKEIVLKRFMQGWASWNGNPLFSIEEGEVKFGTIDHIPDVAPRHERWRTDYRRRPYMRAHTNDQLRDAFDEVIAVTLAGMTAGSPVKLPHEIIMTNMEKFTHIMMEMAERAIPVTEFRHEPERITAAARRLRAGPHVIAWLDKLEREKQAGPSAASQ